MIIVDDKLSLDVLAGRFDVTEPVFTTWGFHYRLLRALGDESRWGTLRRSARGAVLHLAADPPAARLRVLDPRSVTSEAAELAVTHGLNLLAAELVAAARRHHASIHLSSPNVGRRWPELMHAEGISLTVH